MLKYHEFRKISSAKERLSRRDVLGCVGDATGLDFRVKKNLVYGLNLPRRTRNHTMWKSEKHGAGSLAVDDDQVKPFADILSNRLFFSEEGDYDLWFESETVCNKMRMFDQTVQEYFSSDDLPFDCLTDSGTNYPSEISTILPEGGKKRKELVSYQYDGERPLKSSAFYFHGKALANKQRIRYEKDEGDSYINPKAVNAFYLDSCPLKNFISNEEKEYVFSRGNNAVNRTSTEPYIKKVLVDEDY